MELGSSVFIWPLGSIISGLDPQSLLFCSFAVATENGVKMAQNGANIHETGFLPDTAG